MEFISEDELQTFEGWLKYQAPGPLTPESLAMWRKSFEEIHQSADIPKVGTMKLDGTGEHLYGVAVADGSELWLTLWVKRSAKGDVYVFRPCSDRKWSPHTSYHRDGTFHTKSYGRIFGSAEQRQPLRDPSRPFRGTEPLGSYGGHGPKTVGARCDPKAFSGVIEIVPGILGPRDGMVAVELIEPGLKPMEYPGKVIAEQVFREVEPWLAITVLATIHR